MFLIISEDYFLVYKACFCELKITSRVFHFVLELPVSTTHNLVALSTDFCLWGKQNYFCPTLKLSKICFVTLYVSFEVNVVK